MVNDMAVPLSRRNNFVQGTCCSPVVTCPGSSGISFCKKHQEIALYCCKNNNLQKDALHPLVKFRIACFVLHDIMVLKEKQSCSRKILEMAADLPFEMLLPLEELSVQ